MVKSRPFMGFEILGGVGPSEFVRGGFGATVGRASLPLALLLVPLPSGGHMEV